MTSISCLRHSSSRAFEQWAFEQIVVWLQALLLRQALATGDFSCRRQSRCSVIGSSDVTDLPFLDKLAVGRKGLLQRHVLVVAMRLEQVDAIGVETRQGDRRSRGDLGRRREKDGDAQQSRGATRGRLGILPSP